VFTAVFAVELVLKVRKFAAAFFSKSDTTFTVTAVYAHH